MATSTPDKVRVALTGVQETLLATLHAKVCDFASAAPVLNDRFAVETFARIENIHDVRARYPPRPILGGVVAVRTRTFDDGVAEFLAAQKAKSEQQVTNGAGADGSATNVTVLHLACGLDARAQRLHERGCLFPGIRWVDLDVPEVVALRKTLMPTPDLGPGTTYEMIGQSVTERGWMDRIAAETTRTPGAVTLVIMEGLLMYLQPAQSEAVLHDLADRFSRNGGSGQIIFDAISASMDALMHTYARATGFVGFKDIRFPWVIRNARKLEALHEKLKLREVTNLCEAKHITELPITGRVFSYAMSWMPYLRDGWTIVKFTF